MMLLKVVSTICLFGSVFAQNFASVRFSSESTVDFNFEVQFSKNGEPQPLLLTTNTSIVENSTTYAMVKTDLSNGKAMTVNVTIIKGEYFAITDISFTDTGVTHTAESAAKFLTPRYGVYTCTSVIPVELTENNLLEFKNMKFRAYFEGAPTYDEICPRDIKIDAPVAALTGAALAIVIVGIFACLGGFALKKRIQKRKANLE